MEMQEALETYGYMAQLAGQVPEIAAILRQAAAENWTTAKFEYAVQDTNWFKTTSDTERQRMYLTATDPETWHQNLSNATNNVNQIANELGFGGSEKWAQDMAAKAITLGWDEATLREQIARQGQMVTGEGGHLMGNAAETGAKLREMASAYGVPYTDATINAAVASIAKGYNTIADYNALYIQRAKSRYPSLAADLDAGLTVRDIADPYIATMAQTLEISQGDISLSDRTIQRALTNKTNEGLNTAQPLWEFEQNVKKDPRWDKTKNAHEDTAALLMQVGNDWGFLA